MQCQPSTVHHVCPRANEASKYAVDQVFPGFQVIYIYIYILLESVFQEITHSRTLSHGLCVSAECEKVLWVHQPPSCVRPSGRMSHIGLLNLELPATHSILLD